MAGVSAEVVRVMSIRNSLPGDSKESLRRYRENFDRAFGRDDDTLYRRMREAVKPEDLRMWLDGDWDLLQDDESLRKGGRLR